MSAISLRLPNSLHRKLDDLARREGEIDRLVQFSKAGVFQPPSPERNDRCGSLARHLD